MIPCSAVFADLADLRAGAEAASEASLGRRAATVRGRGRRRRRRRPGAAGPTCCGPAAPGSTVERDVGERPLAGDACNASASQTW